MSVGNSVKIIWLSSTCIGIFCFVIDLYTRSWIQWIACGIMLMELSCWVVKRILRNMIFLDEPEFSVSSLNHPCLRSCCWSIAWAISLRRWRWWYSCKSINWWMMRSLRLLSLFCDILNILTGSLEPCSCLGKRSWSDHLVWGTIRWWMSWPCIHDCFGFVELLDHVFFIYIWK